jgi:hypothetical protein
MKKEIFIISRLVLLIFVLFMYFILWGIYSSLKGNEQKEYSGDLGQSEVTYKHVCIDGIVYLESYRRISPYIDKDTKNFMTCREYKEKYLKKEK